MNVLKLSYSSRVLKILLCDFLLIVISCKSQSPKAGGAFLRLYSTIGFENTQLPAIEAGQFARSIA
jgi:hypothetical protein